MIVLSVLTAVAGGVVKQVVSLASDQLRLDIVWGFRKELIKLKESSVLIGNIIHDAAHESEDRESQSRAEWMKRLVNVAYDAEDILDRIQYEVQRIIIKETSLDKKMLSFFSNNPLVFRVKMARKVSKINKSLKDLNNKAAGVGLVMTRRSNGGVAANQGTQNRETTSFLEKNEFTSKDAIIVGRDEVVSNIIAALTNSNNRDKILSVVAIVGLGGIGKTTLARSVLKQLKEGEMAKYFDAKLWVYVSITFDVNSILRRMVESCDATATNLSSREALIESLRNKLANKRVFLVLDDVWNDVRENWDLLKSCLLQVNFNRGSSVIVTTRSARVASIMEALASWDVETLSDDECWSILKDRTFADPNAQIAPELEKIGRDIAKKCAGLPLAAKVLGALMHSKSSKNEWLSILDNQIWQSSVDKEDGRIMSILMLSFDNLTSPLKQCFAYCSMFERGSFINRDELIQLWMAQGFLHPSYDHKNKQEIEMEDMGNMYFDILLDNSLLQEATEHDDFDFLDVIEDGVITRCKMHDLVHDLAIEVSKCESMTPDFRHEEDDHVIRHAARISTSMLEMMPDSSISKWRSLFSNVQASNINFSKLKALRVLSFCDFETQQLPISFGKLKHLRYLDLSITRIEALPKSIGRFYDLQTLRLPQLLPKCPNEIQNLSNLRHLYFSYDMEFEAGILGRLTNLRTLGCFRVGAEIGPTIEELGGLNQLRGRLVIEGLENVRDGEEAKKARLVEKSHLRELAFLWRRYDETPEDNQTDVLDGFEPHGNLQSLKIQNFMGTRIPSWIMSIQNLKEIRLVKCNNCSGVPTLGHLPNLTYVEISEMYKLKCIGVEFYGYGDTSKTFFPALKTFYIEGCKELIEWIEAPTTSAEGQVVPFPCLEELKLSGCGKLRDAPSRYPCLKRLEITRMGSLGNNMITGVLNIAKSLIDLTIRGCGGLTCIAPDVSDGLDSLDALPVLEELRSEECPNLESIRIRDGIPYLRELRIFNCERLSSLDIGLDYCTSLQELHTSNCPNLTTIPIAQGVPLLRKLFIHSCQELSSIGVGLNYCTSLQDLDIYGCHSLTSLPITRSIVSLQRLRIVGCPRLLSLPSGLQFCTSLHHLEITYCSRLLIPSLVDSLSAQVDCRIPARVRQILIRGKLKYMPTGFHRLTCLRSLQIGAFWEELDAFPDFQFPPQLEELVLVGWPKLKSLNQQIPHPTCLKSLSFNYLMGIEALPEWLGNLTSLEFLHISSCKNLKYLPTKNAMRNLTKLMQLTIYKCPLLKERCTQETGPEWPKISHIPELYFSVLW